MKTYIVLLIVAISLAAGDEPDSVNQASLDHQYMVGLTEKRGSVPIDFSDPRQYRFVMHRLAEAGKTVENAPYLYQLIKAQKNTSSVKSDQPDQANQRPWDPNFSVTDHFPLYLMSEDEVNYEATALTTVHDGTEYTFIDVSAWDEDWGQVGNLGWNETYAAGMEVIAACYGELPEGPSSLLYITSFQMYLPIGSDEIKGSFTTQLAGHSPEINLTMPRRSTAGERDYIYACLNRRHSDCDYISMGDTLMRLPFRGSYQLSNAYDFVSFLPDSSLKLMGILDIIGGGGGTAEFHPTMPGTPIESFFSYRAEGGEEYIDWAFTPAAGHFGNVIFDAFSIVHWYLKVNIRERYHLSPDLIRDVTLDINTQMLTYPVDITGEPLLPLSFIYSCLAAGTKILLPDGTSLPVEDVEKGQPVRAGNGILTVQDTSVGIEHLPMIKIRDERGRTLLLTQGHPLLDSKGTIRLASEMKVGQKLTTIDGITGLVSVEKQLYPGHVFNLKLGTPQELAALPEASNTLYANGYLVGDMEMQKELQFKNDQAPLLSRLPKAWHQDYHNSPKRAISK